MDKFEYLQLSESFQTAQNLLAELDKAGIGGVARPWFLSPYQGFILTFLSGPNKGRVLAFGVKQGNVLVVDGETKDFDLDQQPFPSGGAKEKLFQVEEEALDWMIALTKPA